jgi:Zn-dependent M28 family amino/carboxypeptidase
VIGIIRGRDRRLRHETVLLSAHLDHLGTREGMAGDNIFNGADDDASGVTAVLELARALSRGRTPRRTVVFALFGSEEIGGQGSKYFQEHPPVPLESFVANLQFEMIGRPDAAVAPRTLWLTGYERSDLGAQLAAHGARLVADPHPEQNFFRRSDNYALARKGIVAHTISSFGLHTDYHRPSDDLSRVDFKHLTDAIASVVRPITWLVNTRFKPQWAPNGKPE